MKCLPAVAVSLIFSVILSGIAAAEQKAGRKKTAQGLLAMEEEWLNARGPDELEHICAPDFFHVIRDGRMTTRAGEFAYLRAHATPAPAGVYRRFEDMKTRIYGDVGIVNGRTVVTDESGAVVRKTSFTDVFIWRDRRWQAINAQETPLPEEFWNDRPAR